MENPLADLRAALGGLVKANEPLAAHTTLRIGGPADLWISVRSIAELVQSVRLARRLQVPVLVLGNGSNLLVLDGGIRGLVVENHCDGFELNITNTGALLRAESGAPLPGVSNRFARQGWSGLEWAIGVPGTVGGAVIGNAGAHGRCVADNLLALSILDSGGAVRDLAAAELDWGYRHSPFKRAKNEIILRADFRLTRDDPQACIARMNEYTEHRRRTQPSEPSVGSMFKNPPGDYAGRLIDQAGLKGTSIGGIQVSPVHANFFVNRGGATASDVLRLIELARARVRQRFQVELELEIEIVGQARP